MITLAIVLAGALGAPSRYLVERSISIRTGARYPWGTLLVNLLGAGALGLLAGSIEYHHVDRDLARVAGVGFLGAFTTFSTFAVEANRLRLPARLGYLGASLGGGLILAGIGVAITAR
ncbi:MAG: CrcB family protein [Acidimicrobiia bacterium]|nr:CrcB family protein [Acidimicrobiia bacterium]